MDRAGRAALDQIDAWPVDHVGAGSVVRSGATAVAGEHDRPFELASVTKPLTAVAVLVAVQEEVIVLDEPAGPPGATVRHLLAHASGLPLDGSEPIAAPGTRRIYSNSGFELLGELVAARAGMTFATYLDEAVCRPLGMAGTVLDGSPASGARSSVDDLVRLLAELLAPGHVLAAETVREAITPAYPHLIGVLPGFGRQDPNPWGLGLEVRGTKQPHWTPPSASPATFGHFGQSGTFCWVDPDAGVACVALSDRPFGDWARRAWPELGEAVLG